MLVCTILIVCVNEDCGGLKSVVISYLRGLAKKCVIDIWMKMKKENLLWFEMGFVEMITTYQYLGAIFLSNRKTGLEITNRTQKRKVLCNTLFENF